MSKRFSNSNSSSSMIKSNTCLAVLRKGKQLFFAGDRRISWGMHKAQKGPRSKVSYRDGILYAGTGVSAICDEVVELFRAPHREGLDPFAYAHEKFLPALLDFLRNKGYVNRDERKLNGDDDEDLSAIILIGIDTSLFELSLCTSHILLDAIDTPYAHGCGGMYALGAMKALEHSRLTPSNVLTKALKIAADFSPGCDGHIDIVHN